MTLDEIGLINEDHQEMVRLLMKQGSEVRRELSNCDADLWHAATGVSTEAGELLDAIKKKVIYRKELDRQNIIEELGDLEFYLEAVRKNLDITREETLKANMVKLADRYKKYRYSDQAAIDRADKA